ncbi:MAG: MarR family transcriptional regulator [Vicinamibacteria bacterium]
MGSVRDEIKQTRPFPSLADEAIVTLVRTADKARGLGEAAVQPFGITMQQYNVLRILRGAGEKGLPTLEIAARMIEHNPGVTRLLDRLEAKALVRRQRCPQDRRQMLCFATPRALEVLEKADAPLAQASARALAALDEPRVRELIALLDLVRAAASSASAGDPSPRERETEEGED